MFGIRVNASFRRQSFSHGNIVSFLAASSTTPFESQYYCSPSTSLLKLQYHLAGIGKDTVLPAT